MFIFDRGESSWIVHCPKNNLNFLKKEKIRPEPAACAVETAALLEINRRKCHFLWIVVDGVKWKSYIVDISLIHYFHSNSLTNIYWNLTVCQIFATVIGLVCMQIIVGTVYNVHIFFPEEESNSWVYSSTSKAISQLFTSSFPRIKCSVFNVDPSGPFHILEFTQGKLSVYSLKVTV